MYRIALILALALFAASCGGRRFRPPQAGRRGDLALNAYATRSIEQG